MGLLLSWRLLCLLRLSRGVPTNAITTGRPILIEGRNDRPMAKCPMGLHAGGAAALGCP